MRTKAADKKPVAKKQAVKAAKAPCKIGAPTKKTQEIMDTVCQGVAIGKSARAMCVVCNISQPSLWKWLAEDSIFSKQYARAKEECADFIAEEILEIADSGLNDTYTDDKGNVVVNQDVIARSRLRVDARKWYAGKLAPKKYGEKLAVGGADDLPPLQQVHSLSTEALLAIAAGKSPE